MIEVRLPVTDVITPPATASCRSNLNETLTQVSHAALLWVLVSCAQGSRNSPTEKRLFSLDDTDLRITKVFINVDTPDQWPPVVQEGLHGPPHCHPPYDRKAFTRDR